MWRVLLMLLLFSPLVRGQGNPLRAPSENAPRKERSLAPRGTGPGAAVMKRMPFVGKLLQWQKKLNEAMCARLRRLREGFSGWHALLLFAIAFVYGVVHALGPGHAKFIMGSYMLAEGHSGRRSLIAGGIFAATHAGMAVVVFLVFSVILHLTKSSADGMSAFLYRASGVFVAVIGVALLVQVVRGGASHETYLGKQTQRLSLPLLSVAAGLMPCPGTLLLLMFSQILGVPVYGLVSALFLALGMAVTVSGAAYVGGLGSKAVWLSTRRKGLTIALRTVQSLGAAVIVLVGVVMFLG
jgi:ABC-type nickel/cobalt efflux system permease component RcnA